MTFTFAIPFDDIARFRLALNDRDATAHRFEDEFITALIEEYGTWQKAVIAGINIILMELAVPGFTADWLKVDSKDALAFYRARKAELSAEYDLAAGVRWTNEATFPTLRGRCETSDGRRSEPADYCGDETW